MIIPFEQLAPDTLHHLIVDIVTRDGTDYGYREILIDNKVIQVKAKLQEKQAYLCFDEPSGTCNILSKEDCQQLGLLKK